MNRVEQVEIYDFFIAEETELLYVVVDTGIGVLRVMSRKSI